MSTGGSILMSAIALRQQYWAALPGDAPIELKLGASAYRTSEKV